MADPSAESFAFVTPGHVPVLCGVTGGVLRRPGFTESAIDLAALAGLPAMGARAALVSRADPCELAHGQEPHALAERYGLACLAIAELVAYRRRFDRYVVRVADARLPTRTGTFTAYGYSSSLDPGREYLAMVCGEVSPTGGRAPVPAAVHLECVGGTVLRSSACRCRGQLDESLGTVTSEGRGVVLYLPAPLAQRSTTCAAGPTSQTKTKRPPSRYSTTWACLPFG
jgi:3,4-dihydroxy 2-butanone 4-phosphate synthase/GTP cyclohydrolase II